MLVELTITLGDHASNGTEHLLKFVNNELHNLLGVDACLLSLAKSTVLEIEGLPEKGSLIRYPFSFVDKRAAQGGEHSAIFFITWTKLLNDDLKPAIVKLGMQVARMIKASLTQSMKIDGMQSSVSDNQLDYITKVTNFARSAAHRNMPQTGQNDGLFEIAEAAKGAISHGLTSSLWLYDPSKKVLCTQVQSAEGAQKHVYVKPGKNGDIVSIVHDYGEIVNVADHLAHNIYIPGNTGSGEQSTHDEARQDNDTANNKAVAALCVPIRNPRTNEKLGALLMTRTCDGAAFVTGDVKFALCCASLFGKEFNFANQHANFREQSIRMRALQKSKKALKKEVMHLKEQMVVEVAMTDVEGDAMMTIGGHNDETSTPGEQHTKHVEEIILLQEEIALLKRRHENEINKMRTSMEVATLEVKDVEVNRESKEREELQRTIFAKDKKADQLQESYTVVASKYRELQLRSQSDTIAMTFLKVVYRKVRAVSDLYTSLPHAFEAAFVGSSASFFRSDQAQNLGEESPVCNALTKRNTIESQTATYENGIKRTAKIVCLPLVDQGIPVGVIKFEQDCEGSPQIPKHNLIALELMARVAAPLVQTIVQKEELLKSIEEREKELSKHINEAKEKLEASGEKYETLQRERKELYKNLEAAKEKVRNLEYDRLIGQKQIARMERDNEILETKVNDAPQVGFNEDMVRITSEYEKLKKKYRMQTSRFERVVQLLKAYPSTDAPFGLDTLIHR